MANRRINNFSLGSSVHFVKRRNSSLLCSTHQAKLQRVQRLLRLEKQRHRENLQKLRNNLSSVKVIQVNEEFERWVFFKNAGNFESDEDFCNYLLNIEEEKLYEIKTELFSPKKRKIFDEAQLKDKKCFQEVSISIDDPIKKDKIKREKIIEEKREVINNDFSIEICNLDSTSNENLLDIHMEIEDEPKKQDLKVELPKTQKTKTTNNRRRKKNEILADNGEKEENVVTKSEFKCSDCDYISISVNDLDQHENDIHGKSNIELNEDGTQKSFLCEICGNDYKTRRSYWAHKRLQHVHYKIMKCPVESCGIELAHTSYRSHMKLKHSEDEDRYQCSYCGKRFKRADYVRKHEIWNHTRNFPYSCDICNTGFMFPSDLAKHEAEVCRSNEEIIKPVKSRRRQPQFNATAGSRIKGGHIDLSIACAVDTCQFVAKSFQAVKVHSVEYHGMNENFVLYRCAVQDCDYVTKRAPCLFQHHNNRHFLFRKFECKICSRILKTGLALENHIRTHTGERPFKCTICGNAYAQDTTCKGHERKVHGYIRPLVRKAANNRYKMETGGSKPQVINTSIANRIAEASDVIIDQVDLQEESIIIDDTCIRNVVF